jgi:hypothetical protein
MKGRYTSNDVPAGSGQGQKEAEIQVQGGALKLNPNQWPESRWHPDQRQGRTPGRGAGTCLRTRNSHWQGKEKHIQQPGNLCDPE